MKLCECGCGSPAPIAKMTRKRYGHIKGQPTRFINGHNGKGKLSHWWKGGVVKHRGRFLVHMLDHPRSTSTGYVFRYRLIAEKALGKLLPEKAVIHHLDEMRGNDENNNLIICENERYHNLLHLRKRAYENCGHPNWRKCTHCKKYDDPKNLHISPGRGPVYHKKCRSKYDRGRYKHAKENEQEDR